MQQLSQIYTITLLICISLAVGGCSTVGYYKQAVGGHLSLMWSTEPVADLLENPNTPASIKSKLQLTQEARHFARHQLHLPVGDAFSEYAELDRPWVVVNLVAVPEFSLNAHKWCYPVIGCQSYRGYYDLNDARQEEQKFQEQGYDTFIGGVTAYSTLGWFDDPLHSGFIALSEDRMVALMFHELAHQVVYIDEDTAFNESFATAVELEGLRLWLEQQGDARAFQRALNRLKHRNTTLALVSVTTEKLQRLYDQQQQIPLVHLREQKAELLTQLREDYLALAANWQQPGPLGRNPGPLNNANLALFSQYSQHVPAFRQLFRDSDENFERFNEAVEQLSRQNSEIRNSTLAELGQRFHEDF